MSQIFRCFFVRVIVICIGGSTWFQVKGQDTIIQPENPNIRVIKGSGVYEADLILGQHHQFRGNVTTVKNAKGTEIRCDQCVYFMGQSEIAIEIAEVDLSVSLSSNVARMYFRKSFTETFLIPNKLKVQILEMDFDYLSDQPAIMSPLVTDEFMILERSQLVYFESLYDSTSWLANQTRVNLKNGAIHFDGIEVFKPFGISIEPLDGTLVLSKKGNFKPLSDGKIRFQLNGEYHKVEIKRLKFKKGSTYFKAKGSIEVEGERFKIVDLHPEEKAGIWHLTGTVKRAEKGN